MKSANARTSANGRRPAQRKPDLVPPSTERLERSILGGIADDPSLYGVAADLGLRPEHLSLSAHRTIFACMTNVAEQGDQVELPAIIRELERQGKLEAVGDVPYVSGLSDGVVASRSSLERDINLLLERQALRDFCRAAEELFEHGSQSRTKIGDFVNAAKRKLLALEATMDGRRHLRKTLGVLDGGALLNQIGAFIDHYVLLKPAQRDVLSLWVMHTHAFAAADATPYIAVISAEKRSGKTRLLEVAAQLVANPWLTARVSAAVLARKIEDNGPTLLLDESDTAFHSDKEYAEALRGILNSGHRRGGVTSLCVGKGAEITFKDFPTFGPKMIAGIGQLPDTVSDRSIPIQLRRKAPGEGRVERFRFRAVEAQAKPLRDAVASWANAKLPDLCDCRPILPEALNDRQQDGAEPLLAIADLAGDTWPERARAALIEVFGGSVPDDSVRVRLLADVLTVFEETGVARLSSEDLKNALLKMETSPRAEWNHGKPLTPTSLARLLKPFEIFPKTLRIGTATPKGYELSFFTDSWKRYLPNASLCTLMSPSQPQHPPQGSIHEGEAHVSNPQHAGGVAVSKHSDSPIFTGLVAAVVSQSAGTAREDVRGKRRVVEEL